MIESLMLMALGFLVATLFAIIAAQFVWRRAVKVTTQRLTDGDAAENTAKTRELDELLIRQEREQAPLQRELETLRAEHSEIVAANTKLTDANAALTNESSNLRNELAALRADNEALRGHIESAAAARAEHLAAVKRELAGLEAAMAAEAAPNETAPTEEIAEEAAEAGLEDEAVEAVEHAPYVDDAEADARTLAEVKASLARLDAMNIAYAENPEAAENKDEMPEDDEPEADDTAPAGGRRDERLAEGHISDKALMDRIRALEAGVAP